MSYLVFARKYRPQKFEELIGQDPIAKTLKNAIVSNKIGHAYLFSGPRGVGKTTTARIFAKALNCQRELASEPCGECHNCQEITDGSSLDVIEIDGASNRGIDDIRSLRDNVKFAPANSRYKIYIIDEAHQITPDAFNALLKTLEEPPSHIIFMLATTEPQKVPLTILSRCQRYRFRLIPFDDISRYLSKIAQMEGFRIADEALNMIVKAAAGSLRDGLSLMDQMASFSGQEIKTDDVQYVLGYLPRELLDTFVLNLVERDTKKVLEQVSVVSEEGYDLHQFVSDLREYFRKMLVLMSGNEPADESPEGITSLRALIKRITMPEVIRNMRLLSRCLEDMKWSEQPRLVLELYAVRLAEPYVDLQELASRFADVSSDKAEPSETVALPVPAPVPLSTPTPEKKNLELHEPIRDFTVSGHDDGNNRYWESVLKEIERRRPSLSACIKEAQVSHAPESVKLLCSHRYSSEFIARNQEYIATVVHKYSEKKIKIIVEFEESRPAADTEEHAQEEPGSTADGGIEEKEAAEGEQIHHPEDDPGVKKVLEVFPGKIIF